MANKERWYSSTTQVYWTCEALIQGRTISHKTVIREAKGWRLAAIIHTLKKQYSWPIDDQPRGAENIKHYWLKPGTETATLHYPPSAKALADEVTL